SVVAAFGPVPAGRPAPQAGRRRNHWFRPRGCPPAQEMRFRAPQERFPPPPAAGRLPHETRPRPGAGAAACSHAGRDAPRDPARAFVDCRDDSPLEHLERDMLSASAAQQFERAAALRDRLEPLRWLHRHLERLHRARALSFIYPLRSYEGKELWYL